MKIILFTHPSFSGSQSMPRYANMLIQGMKERGHEVEVWTSKARFWNMTSNCSIKKWLGYIDQYIIFPLEVKLKLPKCEKETLFVFSDQALGPWVPLVSQKHHVVHCHDFLALNSALGNVPENNVGLSGKLYQRYIRWGFSKGKKFISISLKTHKDLHLLHQGSIDKSIVCYNGMNRAFEVLDSDKSRRILGEKLKLDLSDGYILHIGGNQYYKNRKGVIEIYSSWRSNSSLNIPLLMVGAIPTDELRTVYQRSLFTNDIYFVTGLSDKYINAAYSGALCLLFPSLDEGFGWPIAEAMASGCVVITTEAAPMTEVGGEAAFYIAKRPCRDKHQIRLWEESACKVLEKVLSLKGSEREQSLEQSCIQSQKFNTVHALDSIEKCYQEILK
jgi:glycosyltransferase involved in cell wall biosynthesis